MKCIPPLLLLPLLAGCIESESGPGPGVGTEITNPDLVSRPRGLTFDPACPGGTRRGLVTLYNQGNWEVEAMAGGTRGEEAYPSAFEVESGGIQEMVVVVPIPADAKGSASGRVEVHHRRTGWDPEMPLMVTEIPWSAKVAEAKAEVTVLCGAEFPCARIDFGTLFTGAVWEMPLAVVNDGCAPLRVERIATEGRAEVVGPALPVPLAPGERWVGRLRLDGKTHGYYEGRVVVETDAPGAPRREVPWSAVLRTP